MAATTPLRAPWLSVEDMPRFVDELLDPQRARPIVAVTTDFADSRRTRIDPDELAEVLGDAARVVVLVTGDSTWELSRRIPEKLGVYGGHVRIWWPGLRPDSDIREHPLIFIHDREGAFRAFDRLQSEVAQFAESHGRADDTEPRPGDVIQGRVHGFERRGAWIAFGRWRGLVACDEIVEGLDLEPTEVLRPGQHVRAEVLRVTPPGPKIALSMGRVSPPLWELVRHRLEAGDVVPARVGQVGNLEARFEVLPGVFGAMRVEAMGANVVHPSRLYREGELVEVRILEIGEEPGDLRLGPAGEGDAERRTGHIALFPGGPLFLEPQGTASPPPQASSEIRRAEERIAQLERQLEDYAQVRERLRAENKSLQERVREWKGRLESQALQIADLRRQLYGSSDPLESEESFARAVELFHERAYTAADKREYPLARLLVGRRFLEDARALEGVDPFKIVEVCAHVASRRDQAVPGKLFHPLRAGEAGIQVVRKRDNAKAWRCALQVNSPSARRLHWWALEGGAVEFAGVGVHDEMGIAE